MHGEIIKKINGNKTSYYEVDFPKKGDKILKYTINSESNEIILYTQIDKGEKFFIKTIYQGFNKIKDIKGFQKGGYTSSSINYYLRDFLDNIFGNKEDDDNPFYQGDIVVLKNGKTNLDETNKKLSLSYDEYIKIHDKIRGIKTGSSNKKKSYLAIFFGKRDSLYKKETTKTTILNIDEWMVNFMTNKEKEKIENIYQKILDSGYQEQIFTIKKKIDLTYLDTIIEEFQKKIMSTKTSEKQRGKFLKEKVFLIFGKYISCINEIGVEETSRKSIDFGMIDIFNFLDVYEIKKPDTELLSNTIDRGNYYWKNPTVKAIIQAEKYLYNIEKNPKIVKKNISKKLKEKDIKFEVIKPRIYLLIGKSAQLDNENKKTDFRILRQSLKNVEIILYDELLDQLKNIQKMLS